MQKSPDLAFNMGEGVQKKFDNINIVRKEGKEKSWYVLVLCIKYSDVQQ